MTKPIFLLALTITACSSDPSTGAPASSGLSSAPASSPSASIAAPTPSDRSDGGSDLSSLFTNGSEYRKPKPPVRIKTGEVVVDGRMPPAVVSRILRQNYGRFRLCYEESLKKTPDLAGQIEIRFTIQKDGSMADTKVERTTLSDPKVVACITRSVVGMSFPSPEAGAEKVRYTLEFIPPIVLKIRGHEIPEVTVSDIAEALSALGYTDVAVKLVGKAATPMLIVGVKGDATATLTFVPATRTATDPSVTNDEERRLTKVGAVYAEGEFFLGVEIPDKKAEAEALLDTLLGRKKPG